MTIFPKSIQESRSVPDGIRNDKLCSLHFMGPEKIALERRLKSGSSGVELTKSPMWQMVVFLQCHLFGRHGGVV